MYVLIYIMCAFVYLFISLFIYSLAHYQVGQVGLSREKGLDIGRRPLHHISFPCSSGKIHLCMIPYFADYYRNYSACTFSY